MPVTQSGPSLSEYLQDVTEALSGVQSERALFRAVLRPTLSALGAVAGVVLLVSEGGGRLELADLEGYSEAAQTVWQQGSLDSDLPAAEAVRRGEPLFFEHADSLRRAYPALEARAGQLQPVASAMLPLTLEGERLGVLVLDFREPHVFSEGERRFLRVLSGQCVLALGRLRATRRLEAQVRARTRQLRERTEALDTFVAFTEAVGGESDARRLAERATALLSAQLPGSRVVYAELEPAGGPGTETGSGQAKTGRWSVMVGEDDWLAGAQLTAPEVFGPLRVGERPLFAAEAGDPRDALYPLDLSGQRRGLLAVRLDGEPGVRPLGEAAGEPDGEPGGEEGPVWSERARALMRAVGRSLSLALERARLTETLQRQNIQLEARNKALEGFADLTRELGGAGSGERDMGERDMDAGGPDGGADALAQRAAESMMALLPQGYAIYYSLQSQGTPQALWVRRAQAGDLRSPELERLVEAGLPYAETRNLAIPWETRRPYYQDAYDRQTDNLAPQMPHVMATVCLPVLVRGAPVGVLGCGLFSGRVWSPGDRAVVESIVSSLGLAIEGAQNASALRQRTRALQQANEELDAFAGSVSHDLRAPVRHVIAFAELAERARQGGQPEKVERALGVIRQSGERMMTLIDAMLQLSRATRQQLRVRPVALGGLVEHARRELEPELGERATGARALHWDVAELPSVSGDPDMLQQVITNLLSNAVKYTRTREQAHVRVRAEETPGSWIITVEDDGVGFDPRYGERLFNMFQRLHGPEQFEGVGVGLANVRRVVNRHGGQVWAEGRLGEGASFSFSLPK